MAIIKSNWSSLSNEPISEDAVRALHQPQKNYKVYVNRIEPGKTFTTKAGHNFVLYILSGACKTTIDGVALTLSAAELVALEKGSYGFDVLGNEELTIMKVFSLL